MTTPSKIIIEAYTPGPWIVAEGDCPPLGSTALGVLAANHKIGENGPAVCVISQLLKTNPRDHANARLIAAAPDLLSTVEKLAAWDKRWPKGSDTYGTSEKELNALCEESHAILGKLWQSSTNSQPTNQNPK